MEEKTLKNILEEDPSPEKLQQELKAVEKLAKALEDCEGKMDFNIGRINGSIRRHKSSHSLDPDRIIIHLTNIWDFQHSNGYSEDYSLPGYEQVWMASSPDDEGNVGNDWFYGWEKVIRV